jgi:16S rRNA (cytosine967-C5)-methyltransferase
VKKLNEKIINRQTALLGEILETLVPRVLDRGHPADRVLAQFFKNRRELGSRDRRFLSEAFFSFFRWFGWTQKPGLTFLEAAGLSWLLDHVEIHPALEKVIRPGWTLLGGKTVDEKCAALAGWFPDFQTLEKPALVFPEFGKSVALPPDCEALFYETIQQRPPTWLRLRSDEFKQTLTAAGIEFKEHPNLPGSVAVGGGASLSALGCHGQYEVQDIASQAVALIASPETGSDWWDACSGAGGKALQLADLIGPEGKVLATDVRESALRECKKRARTDGLPIVRTQIHNLAEDAPFSKVFDGVLVDAPCSGWGTWSRNPDARWRSDPRDPAQKRNLQLRMLNNAAQCVKSGGVLIFSVCTFTREETAEVADRFRSEHPEFSLNPFENPLTGIQTEGTLQIWPWEGPGDGIFTARFLRA